MIDLYSGMTGKAKGMTKDVPGVEYYGKGYEDSDLRIPSMRLVKQQVRLLSDLGMTGAWCSRVVLAVG